MSVLAKNNLLAQQRLDLSTLLSSESFTAYDFRSLVGFFTGSSQTYIIRGFEIVNKSQFEIQVKVADGLVFNPQDNNGSFYLGLKDDPVQSISLAQSQTFYVEAVFTNETINPVNQAFWNPLALNQDDAAGNQFSASANSQNVLVLSIPSPNTTGFTSGSIPLYKITTDSNQITAITDCRPLLFRLGTGGSIPDAGHKFPWATNRAEPVNQGTGVGQTSTSPFLSANGSGVLNDKGITTLKEWMDAVMTRIAEITGSSVWYSTSLANNYIDGLDLNTVYFDSAGGHSLNPTVDVSFKWNKTLTLSSQGQAPAEWQANYSDVRWRLGGTFTSSSLHTYSDSKFTSPVPANGGNLYLILKRDIPITVTDNAVNWKPAAVPSVYSGQTDVIITGAAGDFTGLAIGDYVRKVSEGYSSYYRVVSYTSGDLGVEITTSQSVADSSVTALKVSRTISGASSVERIRIFVSNYTSADLVADTSQINVDAGIFPYQDIDAYWMGRRVDNKFMLRGFGALELGEEIEAGGNSETENGGGSGGASDILINHAFNARFTSANVYALKTGTGSLLTLHRRKRDNDVETPGPTDNSSALLTYTIQNSIVSAMSVGDTLWVKLNDTIGGTLALGTVVNSSEDSNNLNTTSNVYQVLSAASTPLRNYNNKDVYQIARCTASGSLLFYDGSVLNDWGLYLNQHVETQGDIKADADVYLMTKTNNSVLFIDEQLRIQQDNANFFYDDGGSLFGVFNHRFSPNTIDITTPTEQTWLANLGANALNIGADSSTVRILGDLVVDGDTFAIMTPVIVSEDPNIVLGAGNANNGGGGSGISVADNTLSATTISSIITRTYVDVLYSSAHGYALSDSITINANVGVGGITAGQMNIVYLVTGSGNIISGSSGTAVLFNSTTLRVFTSGTATSSATVSLMAPVWMVRSFTAPSYFQMTDASGLASGMTSWAFRVKGVAQTVTITPVSGFNVVPTAKSTNFSNMRIPFVTNDNAGPSATDSTLDFNDALSFDAVSLTLSVKGIAAIQEGQFSPIVTSAANTKAVWIKNASGTIVDQYGLYIDDLSVGTNNYGIYSTVSLAANRWNIYVAGTGASYFNGPVGFGQTVQAQMTSRINVGAAGSTTAAEGILFGSDANLYRISAGMLHTDTAFDLGTYERFTNYAINTAPVTPPSGKVSVFARENLIWQVDSNGTIYPLTSPLGNVYDEPLAIVASGASGNNQINIASVTPPTTITIPTDSRSVPAAFQTRTYQVGAGELEVYLNGDLLEAGFDYTEVGVFGSFSSQITILAATSMSVGDRLRFRVDSNGGQLIVASGGGGGGSSTMQLTYANGSSITTSLGVPLTINGPSGDKLLSVNGDMYVSGVIDPKGITFIPQVSNPLPGGQSGIWTNPSGDMMWQNSVDSTTINLTTVASNVGSSLQLTVIMNNFSGSTIDIFTPVSVNGSGTLSPITVSNEFSALAAFGVTKENILNNASGQVVTLGALPNVTGFSFGDIVYVSKTGTLTSVKPSIGVSGFVSEDFVIRVGMVVANNNDGNQKDVIVNMQMVGQL